MKIAAYLIDRFLIIFYTAIGNADGPCGSIQTWARKIRNKDITANLLKDPTDV